MGEQKETKGWDVQGIVNHMSLMFSYVQEHGTDAFRELVQKDPTKASEQLPIYLDKILRAGDRFFNYPGCGGPHEMVTAPLIDSVGLVYPCLDKPQREKALRSCLKFFDEQNYFLVQNNVAYINEPWLVGDIILNRPLYWCGFKELSDRLKPLATWSDWEAAFLDEQGRLDAKSVGWLSVAVGWKENASELVRRGFAERYPGIVERTKDVIAGWAHIRGIREQYEEEKPMPYQKRCEKFYTHFEPEWLQGVPEQLGQKNFIVLEETIRRLEESKERRERDAREKQG